MSGMAYRLRRHTEEGEVGAMPPETLRGRVGHRFTEDAQALQYPVLVLG